MHINKHSDGYVWNLPSDSIRKDSVAESPYSTCILYC